LEQCDLQIGTLNLSSWDNYPVTRDLYGISLWFISGDEGINAVMEGLTIHYVSIEFEEKLPYDKALSLIKKYGGDFTD